MLDKTLYALSDSTRRSILGRLAQKECSVNEIAEPYDMSLAAVRTPDRSGKADQGIQNILGGQV